MFTEDDLLPLSGLQHLLFCERQWGLIHIEQIWEENRLTAEGRALHERAHSDETESRGAIRIARGLRLHSLTLGLAGQADVVEFHAAAEGVPIPGLDGRWRPFPVEYKRGKPKRNACDEVQLCAQGLCLEEMYGAPVPGGALFYGQPRRRTAVLFTASLRNQVAGLAARMHALHAAGTTPIRYFEPKCRSCSLLEPCMPGVLANSGSVHQYLASARAAPARLQTDEEPTANRRRGEPGSASSGEALKMGPGPGGAL